MLCCFLSDYTGRPTPKSVAYRATLTDHLCCRARRRNHHLIATQNTIDQQRQYILHNHGQPCGLQYAYLTLRLVLPPGQKPQKDRQTTKNLCLSFVVVFKPGGKSDMHCMLINNPQQPMIIMRITH